MSQRRTASKARPVVVSWLALVFFLTLAACRSSNKNLPSNDGPPPWATAPIAEPERPGMVWVPPGMLIAGTPPGRLPRIADQELPGEKLELRGFFIDRYNHPGELGAIPETGLTQQAAREICEKYGKRLCTELELERACKGPDNRTYEYGDVFDGATCGMETSDALAPNGLNTRCESAWGVHDLHGSAWTWTSSAWGRGGDGSKVSVRGGSGKNGPLLGRCAHARALKPTERDPAVGVRCCAGVANAAEVALEVTRKTELVWKPPTVLVAQQLDAIAPEELRNISKSKANVAFHIERTWVWRPIGNEELLIGGGCAKKAGGPACGILIVRMSDVGPERLAWVSSDEWIATVDRHEISRGIYVYGGDRRGAYRKPVLFDWGQLSEGSKERKKGGGWVRPIEGRN